MEKDVLLDRVCYNKLQEKERTIHMIFGVDYYPEHWDRSEWEDQAKLMKEGGFNTVRMGEFGWKLMEPEEGKFDFAWLDEAIEVLSKEGIKVILGTPTAAPPQWLVKKYDVL